MYIPRFRKIEQVVEEIKEFDPNSDLSSWRMLKTLLSEGKITQMKLGNAWLINTDELYSIFWKEDKNENNNNR